VRVGGLGVSFKMKKKNWIGGGERKKSSKTKTKIRSEKGKENKVITTRFLCQPLNYLIALLARVGL